MHVVFGWYLIYCKNSFSRSPVKFHWFQKKKEFGLLINPRFDQIERTPALDGWKTFMTNQKGSSKVNGILIWSRVKSQIVDISICTFIAYSWTEQKISSDSVVKDFYLKFKKFTFASSPVHLVEDRAWWRPCPPHSRNFLQRKMSGDKYFFSFKFCRWATFASTHHVSLHVSVCDFRLRVSYLLSDTLLWGVCFC